MANQANRIVLLARYTTLVGPASGSVSFFTPSVNVRAFSKADLTAWGTSPPAGTAACVLQESADLASWSDKGTVTVSGSQDVTSFSPLDTEWVRLKVTMSNGARQTLWVVGEFALRGA